MAAHQAPPSLGFSRQEHWSGLPFPSPMHESEKSKWSRSVMSNPQRPHGLQPSRLLHPWDFPGKSTGVGCHCLLHSLFAIIVYYRKSILLKGSKEKEKGSLGESCMDGLTFPSNMWQHVGSINQGSSPGLSVQNYFLIKGDICSTWRIQENISKTRNYPQF